MEELHAYFNAIYSIVTTPISVFGYSFSFFSVTVFCLMIIIFVTVVRGLSE